MKSYPPVVFTAAALREQKLLRGFVRCRLQEKNYRGGLFVAALREQKLPGSTGRCKLRSKKLLEQAVKTKSVSE